MPYVVQILPKYQKWAVALPLFFIFVISSFLVSYMSPFINLFNALGKVKYSFGFMFVWTVITWILTPILTHRFGYYGFPITHLTVSLTFMFVVMKAKKFADFDITRLIGPFMFSTFFMLVTAGSAGFLLHLAPIAEALIVSIIAAATYILSLQYVFKMNLRHEVGSFLALRHQS